MKEPVLKLDYRGKRIAAGLAKKPLPPPYALDNSAFACLAPFRDKNIIIDRAPQFENWS